MQALLLQSPTKDALLTKLLHVTKKSKHFAQVLQLTVSGIRDKFELVVNNLQEDKRGEQELATKTKDKCMHNDSNTHNENVWSKIGSPCLHSLIPQTQR